MTFAAPATSTGGVKPADLNGHLLLIMPIEYKAGIVTSMGEAEAIECEVVDLDTNEEHTSVLFFNIALRNALRPNIGAQVLGRIGQGVAKPGKNAPWILNDATTNKADIDKATAYLAAKATGTFKPAAPATASAPAETEASAAAAALAALGVDVNDPSAAALLAQLKNK